MAWIESHETLAGHPKTKRLARELGEDIPSVVGRLHLFWWWAMNYAQDGDVTRYTEYDIADAVMWGGDPQKLVDAFCVAGFIDRIDDRVHIHDWFDYAGRLIEKKKQNAERKRMSRGRHADVTETSLRRTQDVSVSHRATIPNLTIPKDIPSADASEKVEMSIHIRKSDYTTEFEQFWSIYPKRVEKKKAFKQWNTRLKQGVDVSTIITAAENYANYCRVNNTATNYIKHPSTFLGPDTPYEEFVQVMQEVAAGEEKNERPGPHIDRDVPKEVQEILNRMQGSGYM